MTEIANRGRRKEQRARDPENFFFGGGGRGEFLLVKFRLLIVQGEDFA